MIGVSGERDVMTLNSTETATTATSLVSKLVPSLELLGTRRVQSKLTMLTDLETANHYFFFLERQGVPIF